MATLVTRTLKKDGTGDYTTISAFCAAEAANLVVADQILRLEIYKPGWNKAAPLTEDFIEVGNNFTTDATRYLEFYVADSDRHNFTEDTGFVMSLNATYGFVIRGEYVIIDGFEFSGISCSWGPWFQDANLTVRNTILYDPTGSRLRASKAENCIAYNYPTSNTSEAAMFGGSSTDNCTAIIVGGNSSFAGNIAINNGAINNTLVYKEMDVTAYDAYYAVTGDYNGVNRVGEGIDSQTNSLTTLTQADFVDFANKDYRLKSTSPFATAGSGGSFMGAAVDPGGGGEVLAIDSGSYSLTGTNVNLTVQYKSTLESGSYSLSGSALGLIHDSKLIADSGAYSLTGTQANLTAARKIIADSGSYNLTGTDVTLVYTPVGGGEVLSIDSGTFSLSGSDIGLKATRLISANSGSYNLTGQSVALTYNAKTIIDSGSYALTGSNVNLFANRVIIAQNGSYNLTGSTVTLRYSGEVTQTIGTVSTSFAADKYSASYKPTSITVNFKE